MIVNLFDSLSSSLALIVVVPSFKAKTTPSLETLATLESLLTKVTFVLSPFVFNSIVKLSPTANSLLLAEISNVKFWSLLSLVGLSLFPQALIEPNVKIPAKANAI